MISMHGKVALTSNRFPIFSSFWNISQKGDRFPDLGQDAARRAAVKGDNNPFRFLYHLLRLNPHPLCIQMSLCLLESNHPRWQGARSSPRGIFSVGKIPIGSSTLVAARYVENKLANFRLMGYPNKLWCISPTFIHVILFILNHTFTNPPTQRLARKLLT